MAISKDRSMFRGMWCIGWPLVSPSPAYIIPMNQRLGAEGGDTKL